MTCFGRDGIEHMLAGLAIGRAIHDIAVGFVDPGEVEPAERNIIAFSQERLEGLRLHQATGPRLEGALRKLSIVAVGAAGTSELSLICGIEYSAHGPRRGRRCAPEIFVFGGQKIDQSDRD
jgi:hypothetical protein